MLIVCPSCASEYEIDAARIGAAGRQVRCAGCASAWFVEAESVSQLPAHWTAPEHRPVPVSYGEPAATAEPARPQDAKGKRAKSPAGEARAARRPFVTSGRLAAAFVLALAVAAPTLIALRTDVVRAVPGSAGLYAAVGLPVNLVGLKLGDVSSGLVEETNGRVLVVEGEIKHAASGAVSVPKLDFVVEGAAGETLYRWSSAPPVTEIAPGESARFTARLPSPPPNGRRVLVSFVTAPVRDAVALR